MTQKMSVEDVVRAMDSRLVGFHMKGVEELANPGKSSPSKVIKAPRS